MVHATGFGAAAFVVFPQVYLYVLFCWLIEKEESAMKKLAVCLCLLVALPVWAISAWAAEQRHPADAEDRAANGSRSARRKCISELLQTCYAQVVSRVIEFRMKDSEGFTRRGWKSLEHFPVASVYIGKRTKAWSRPR